MSTSQPATNNSTDKPALSATPGTFLERARILVERGIPVAPVQPRLKECWLSEWQNKATTDIEKLEIWNAENPDYNTAAVGKLEITLALDIDDRQIYERIRDEAGIDLKQFRTFKV